MLPTVSDCMIFNWCYMYNLHSHRHVLYQPLYLWNDPNDPTWVVTCSFVDMNTSRIISVCSSFLRSFWLREYHGIPVRFKPTLNSIHERKSATDVWAEVTHIHIHIHIHIHLSRDIHRQIYTYIYIWKYTYTYVYIHFCIYIYIYIHVYIYIYICT